MTLILGYLQPACCAAMAAGWTSRSRTAAWSASAAELRTGSIMAASDPKVCTAGKGSFMID